MSSSTPLIPQGFRPLRVGGPFMQTNGPLYGRLSQELGGRPRVHVGFRVLPAHTNPMGVCHGGMLATLADMLAAICVPYQTDLPRHFLPTISLQMDFLAPARQGDWVQAQVDVLRTTRNLVFTQGLIHAGDEVALRVSAIYKIGPLFQAEDEMPGDPFGLSETQRT
ncbi:MAG: PaaI family thioesterase [Alphaproteobacteria bacterium]|nr:PaaI family thioesterase [Alphaproteobacteria bacterium]